MKAKQEHSGVTTVTRNGYTMGRSAETAENEIGGVAFKNIFNADTGGIVMTGSAVA